MLRRILTLSCLKGSFRIVYASLHVVVVVYVTCEVEWRLLNFRENIYNNKSAETQQKRYTQIRLCRRLGEGRVTPAGRSFNEVAI